MIYILTLSKNRHFYIAERFFVFVVLRGIIMAEQTPVLYRKKALERITAPEQLTDYLRVTNPGIWTLFAAIIILLAGMFLWSTVGTLETTADGVAEIKDGQAMIVVTENTGNAVMPGMTVRIDGSDYKISDVQKDDYGRSTAYAPIDRTDGKYDVKIVTESIHPIRFLFD